MRMEAKAHTRRMLEVYRACAEEDLAMPVIAGEKPENERFPGAVETWSIEAMMQDGKALQAGTSHYLGTNFSEAAGIRFQNPEGSQELCHTTSWGVSTRMIGGVIMVHGDDDGLRVPPTIAPRQIVILPMLRGKDEVDDAALVDYCEGLRADLVKASAFGEKLRVAMDVRPGKAAAKRWDYVRKGAPIIIEVGGRDRDNERRQPAAPRCLVGGKRQTGICDSFARRRGGDDPRIAGRDTGQSLCSGGAAQGCEYPPRHHGHGRASGVLRRRCETSPAGRKYRGPSPPAPALEKIVEQLKAMRLTIRNVPIDAPPVQGACIFTGDRAVERIYVAKAY